MFAGEPFAAARWLHPLHLGTVLGCMTRSSGESPPGRSLAAALVTIQPRLYGFILKRLADHEQTWDVLQKTNLLICEKADDFEMGTNFDAWAFTIARFQVMAWRKSQARSKLIFSDAVFEMIDQDPAEEAKAATSRIAALRQCVQRLKPADRSLLQQRYGDALSIAVIAGILDTTVAALTMKLSRLRRQLAACISQQLDVVSLRD